jgi:hypothetical protein
LQQTPSAQNPEAHWSPDLQVAPIFSLPQLFITHACPLTHSALDVHDVWQAPVPGLQV